MSVDLDRAPRRHSVHFASEHDGRAAIVETLRDAVDHGGAAIVIAMPATSAVLRAGLVATAAAPRITVLDAAETLDRLLVDGELDADRFDDEIGTMVRTAAGGGGPLAVYGEMVALLWESGDVAGALELEGLWNDLLGHVDFELICGYPASLVAGAHVAEAFSQVCDLHGSVIEGPPVPDAEVTRHFMVGAQAPRSARRYVAAVLSAWGLDDLIAEASVVVAELSTNAVMHARSSFCVGVSREADCLVVSVTDTSADAPAKRIPSGRAPGGRGLHLVDSLAQRWGHHRVDGGKVVWAELDGAVQGTAAARS